MNVAAPVASVVALVGLTVPAVRFVSIEIGMLAIPTPAEFVTVALIVVVSGGTMTGFVVESVSWAEGIGGPIVLSIAFVFVAVRPLYVTFAVAVPEP